MTTPYPRVFLRIVPSIIAKKKRLTKGTPIFIKESANLLNKAPKSPLVGD